MRKLIIFSLSILIMSCGAKKNLSSSSDKDLGEGDTRTKKVKSIDDMTYLIEDKTDDETYGYSADNPVKVGGVTEGPVNERRYLNGLVGPKGEDIEYYRISSCCPFKTPHGLIDNTGMLDKYAVYWKNSPDTLVIYINMYDKGDLFVPVGLQAKTSNTRL